MNTEKSKSKKSKTKRRWVVYKPRNAERGKGEWLRSFRSEVARDGTR